MIATFQGGPLNGETRQLENAASIYEIQMEPHFPVGSNRIAYRTGVYRRVRRSTTFAFVGARDGGVR